MSHTPGPWTWAPFRQGLFGADGSPVLDWAEYEGLDLDGDEKANAALIAAAPELLNAFKSILALSDVEMRDGDEARAIAQRMIAKAEAA